MSHVATVELEIRDLDAFAEACKRVGVEFVRGKNTYRWWGNASDSRKFVDAGDGYEIHVGRRRIPCKYEPGFGFGDLGKCDHAIRVPGKPKAYEIGVVKRRDGRPGYQLMADMYKGGFGIEKKVGENCCHLKKEYAAVVAIRKAQQSGFTVQENRLANGAIQLRLTR